LPKCEYCGKEVDLPFECKFCGGYFCVEHRLPENHECMHLPPRTPLGPWKAKKYPEFKLPTSENPQKAKRKERIIKEGKFFFVKERKQDREEIKKFLFKRSYNITLNRELLISLKVWFPIFLLLIVSLSLLESSDPVHFYHKVPSEFRYFLYVFAGFIGLWCGYKIFDKCDYEPSSDRGIFGLRLLSTAVLIASILILVFACILIMSGAFIKPEVSLARETFCVFLFTLSVILMVLSSYLLFKFQRRSGIIVYRR